MALVRFSNDLRADILRRASDTFESRVEKLRPELDPSWGDKIYNRLMRDQLEHIKKLDEAWFNTYSDMTITGVVLRVDGEPTECMVQQSFSFVENRPYPNRNQKFLEGRAAQDTYRANSLKLIGPEWEDYYNELAPQVEAFEQARADRSTFVEGVRAVIHTHSSLNPALRAWPALWDLVPEYAKEKHREVVVKGTPAERAKTTLADQGVDLDKLTTNMTMAKIKGEL